MKRLLNKILDWICPVKPFAIRLIPHTSDSLVIEYRREGRCTSWIQAQRYYNPFFRKLIILMTLLTGTRYMFRTTRPFKQRKNWNVSRHTRSFIKSTRRTNSRSSYATLTNTTSGVLKEKTYSINFEKDS